MTAEMIFIPGTTTAQSTAFLRLHPCCSLFFPHSDVHFCSNEPTMGAAAHKAHCDSHDGDNSTDVHKQRHGKEGARHHHCQSRLLEQLAQNDVHLTVARIDTRRTRNRSSSDESVIIQIAKALPNNTYLQELHLNGCGIGAEGATALVALGLNNNNKNPVSALRVLNLAMNRIGNEGAKAIGEYLQSGKNRIQCINLAGNNIGDTGAVCLARGLERDQSLTSLFLGANCIGDVGAAAIATSLETTNRTVRGVYLRFNQIGTEGAKAFAQALRMNTTISTLCLDGNPMIGLTGLEAIAKSLETNNMTIRNLALDPSRYDGTIELYLHLNKIGRRLLKVVDSNPHPHLWAIILGKAATAGYDQGAPSMVFYLLQQVPDLCKFALEEYDEKSYLLCKDDAGSASPSGALKASRCDLAVT